MKVGKLKGRKIKNPHVFAGLFPRGNAFWKAFSAELAMFYDLSDTQIAINGDGAAWIQRTVTEHFPGGIIRLDKYHLKRDLHTTLGPKKASELLALLNKGDIHSVIDTLQAIGIGIPKQLQTVSKTPARLSSGIRKKVQGH